MEDPKEGLDVVELAKKRFRQAQAYYGPLRKLALDDTRFALGDSDNGWQWDTEIRQSRQANQKVCLTVNVTAQHCNQVVNAIRQNRPQAKVVPANNDQSNKHVAEILTDVIRSLQIASSADTARDMAAEHMVLGGEGYWRIVADYEDDTSFNQTLKTVAVKDPHSVFIDPFTTMPDKSDAKWGFVIEDMGKERAFDLFPNIDATNWEMDSDGWVDNETIRVADYYYAKEVTENVCLLADGGTCYETELPDGAQVIQTRQGTRTVWTMCKLVGGHDKPVQSTRWLGKYLPIISCIGKEMFVGGEVVRKGIVRDLKDPARMVNLHYSASTEAISMQTKVPYVIAHESVAGFEDKWGRLNVSNDAYLPFKAYDAEGKPLPQPRREPPAVMPQAHVQMLEISLEQMRAASGQQNANFGIKSDAQSGVGIQRLKQQGEIATFHFPDNLRRSMEYETRIYLDLIPKYLDTKRVIRLMGIDGSVSHAMVDPNMDQAYMEVPNAEDVMKIFNPSRGKYDVVIDTGPSYQTQRQETSAMLTDIAARNPAFMQIAGDLYFRSQDFPLADKLADRWAKTLPPQLQDQKGIDQATKLGQQVQSMGMQMQEMQQQGMALEQQMQEKAQQEEQLVNENNTLKQQLMVERQKSAEAQLKAKQAEFEQHKAEGMLELVREASAETDKLNAAKMQAMTEMQAQEESPEEKPEKPDQALQVAELLAQALHRINNRPPAHIEVTRTPQGLVGSFQPITESVE